MRTIPNSLKFLHCMSQPDYLEKALSEGIMLTDHKVEFVPTNDSTEYSSLLNRVMPLLTGKLITLGKPLDTLDELRKQVLFSGLGSMRGDVPMLCFSEIPSGKSLDHHRFSFGSFAIVVKSEWLARQNAERVIYVGRNSPASQQLYHCLATMHVLGLHVDSTGDVLFNNVTMSAILDLLPYVEVRDHLEEAEWRVVGKTGWIKGKRETNKKLPIELCDIEYIFVPSSAVDRFSAQVSALGKQQGCLALPQVISFPSQIP